MLHVANAVFQIERPMEAAGFLRRARFAAGCRKRIRRFPVDVDVYLGGKLLPGALPHPGCGFFGLCLLRKVVKDVCLGVGRHVLRPVREL